MSADPYARIAEALGGRLLRRWSLTGGVSAEVHAIEITENQGATTRLVVRRLGAAEWKAGEPGAAGQEHALLSALAETDLPTPRPRLLDVSGDLLPGPYLVLEHIEGSREAPPEPLAAMAALLARVHATQAPSLPTLPLRDDPVGEALTYLPVGFEATAAQLRAMGPSPSPERALLHGDYWSGNLLWRGDALVGLIDWEDAAVGDPLADLAGARVELVWAQGFEAAEAFTQAYVAASGRALDRRRLALWELFVGAAGAAYMAHWGLPEAQLKRQLEMSQAFLERAAAEI